MSEAPSIQDVAEQVARAMVAAEPITPLGWAIAHDEAGKPLYLVAVVMGQKNVNDFQDGLKRIFPHMKRVDTFDGTVGEPEKHRQD